MAKGAILLINADLTIVEWLTSNPVGEVFSTKTPVMGLAYKTKRSEGFRRWPIVPEQSFGLGQ